MKRLVLSVALLAIAASVPLWEKTVTRAVRISIWSAVFLVSVSVLAVGVFQKRREGKSWSEALALGSTFVTGSIWLDGVLFAAILILICAAVFLLFYLA